MAPYSDMDLQGTIKEQLFRCKLHMLERKCSTGVEKLRVLIGEHLHNGIPASDILEKTVSFFTVRKALLSHNGYSRCTREFLRLSSTPDEDVVPLCLFTDDEDRALTFSFAEDVDQLQLSWS